MMAEVPIVIKNSHLMNALLLELQEQLTLDVGGAQFLDLGTSGSLNIFWSLYGAVLRIRIRWIGKILASWIRIRIFSGFLNGSSSFSIKISKINKTKNSKILLC